MTYPANEPETLFQIREELKKAGLRDPENQITYAIKKTEELRSNLLEQTFSFLLFDLTCQFGMAPGRPLKILWYAFLSFALLYIFAQKWPGPTGGIWAQWSEHRIRLTQGKDSPERLMAFRLQSSRILGSDAKRDVSAQAVLAWPSILVSSPPCVSAGMI